MQSQHAELVIIGAGPGGYVSAIRAAQLGLNVALIERQDVGGVCLNRGCVPTKTLLHTADIYDEALQGADIGIELGSIKINYETLRGRKNDICTGLREGVEQLLDANGVILHRGNAVVQSDCLVSVCASDGTATSISFDKLIIASGSNPAVPPIEGINCDNVYNSDTILDEVPEIESLCIIGGGVIGMEFANLYRSLGTKVYVIEAASRILSTIDKEFSQTLSMKLKKDGCEIACNAFVEKIENIGSKCQVSYSQNDKDAKILASAVLVCTGRTANTGGLFAEDFKLDCDRGRISVDDLMQTSVKNIYAIGDVCNYGIQLAHAASAQGLIAVEHIAGREVRIKPHIVPSCVYTNPEIATVGLTEAEAKERGIEYRIGKIAMTANAKTQIAKLSRGFIKVVVDKNDKVIGAHVMCGRATDLIDEFVLAIANEMTVADMLKSVRAHPTFAEAIGEAFEQLEDGAIHALPKRK